MLIPGANAPLTFSDLKVTIRHGTIAGAEVDISAFLVGPAGKVRSDADMCFYAQKSVGAGAVAIDGSGSGQIVFNVYLSRMPSGIEKVIFAATIHENRTTFGRLSTINLDFGGIKGEIACAGMTETALILAELYQRNGTWKVRVIGQGFRGGLAALATHLGVEIDEASAPASAPAPAAPRSPSPPVPASPAANVSLTKVTLTKHSSTVSLRKDDGRFGKIRVNLNWHQEKKSGLFSFGNSSVDLDLGAFVETRDGRKFVVQALGNTFGDFERPPYARLLDDDRTGASTDGEWLHINGDRWDEVRRVLIYASIYEGAPNWQKTDGVVRLLVPGQPEVEVRMNEYGDSRGCCVVALLDNQGGQVKVTREVTFHKNQEFIDSAYNWGFRWTVGRK